MSLAGAGTVGTVITVGKVVDPADKAEVMNTGMRMVKKIPGGTTLDMRMNTIMTAFIRERKKIGGRSMGIIIIIIIKKEIKASISDCKK